MFSLHQSPSQSAKLGAFPIHFSIIYSLPRPHVVFCTCTECMQYGSKKQRKRNSVQRCTNQQQPIIGSSSEEVTNERTNDNIDNHDCGTEQKHAREMKNVTQVSPLTFRCRRHSPRLLTAAPLRLRRLLWQRRRQRQRRRPRPTARPHSKPLQSRL